MPDASPFTIRPAAPEDARGGDRLLRDAFHGREATVAGVRDWASLGLASMLQTGHRVLVAERDGRLAGLVRWWFEEGVAWFDLLVAAETGAGRALVRAVEQAAQDRGLRSLRASVPAGAALEDLARWWGYFPVAGALPEGLAPQAIFEKRLPLLTVREQRRGDADAMAALTGDDPWPFTQGPRPGWFVLADGDRVAGVVSGRMGRDGVVRIAEPALAEGYEGRGLEVWMAARVALWASTQGAFRAEIAVTPALERYERDFEERHWHREGAVFATALAPPGLSATGEDAGDAFSRA